MEIYTTNASFLLVETDIVEAFETGSINGADTMVGNEEVFLPTHENVLSLSQVRDSDGSLSYLFGVLSECCEFAPVTQIDFIRCTPARVLCDKFVFTADNLALEIRRQRRVIFS